MFEVVATGVGINVLPESPGLEVSLQGGVVAVLGVGYGSPAFGGVFVGAVGQDRCQGLEYFGWDEVIPEFPGVQFGAW